MFGIQGGANESVLEGIANDETQYIVNEIITNKVENPATIDKTTLIADGVDAATISVLPNPSLIYVNDEIYTVIDGVFGFTVDTPGNYIVRCTAFPYLIKEFIVNAS